MAWTEVTASNKLHLNLHYILVKEDLLQAQVSVCPVLIL